ncbi:Hsp20/alpha crystallin family protein [Candidatus Pseudoscillospira sp. SGI.172]|uniref:Hsp20/alpha crystallin family protein n=1 Tax=Candidatus Pseudoscillospira sp. SGI.172 TaxID=3420582 RepID=UPI0009BBE24F|nr:Hsp20/alpha crystallin family protein [Pseudoflavonifractor sp.]MDY3020483.1 Hsp20/alpha crystallin family protein [Oscillospiraceae bacterium]
MFGMLPFERSDNNLFDSFDNFARDFFRKSNTDLPAFRTDIRDDGDHFTLEADLPGFNKEDISLDLKDSILTISAIHQESDEQKDDKGNYIRRERRYGSFQRSFDVTGIDQSGISAAYQNGVLTLSLPKERPVEPESYKIAIQ